MRLLATVFLHGPFRFFFWSKDLSERMHVHVENSDGMIKIWLPELTVVVVRRGMKSSDVERAVRIAANRYDEIVTKWEEESRKMH